MKMSPIIQQEMIRPSLCRNSEEVQIQILRLMTKSENKIKILRKIVKMNVTDLPPKDLCSVMSAVMSYMKDSWERITHIERRRKTWQTYSFGLSVADRQGFIWRVFRLQRFQFVAEIVENLQSALKHRQTNEPSLMEDRDVKSKRTFKIWPILYIEADTDEIW